MSAPYADRVVVITGGAGGIGTALAMRYRQAGAAVIVLDRDAEALDALAASHSGGVDTRVVDITDSDACQGVIGAIVRDHGGIDVLINNAGLTQIGLCVDNDLAVYRRVMEVNYFGAVAITKAALPSLIARRGAIAVMSSVAGFAPLVNRTGYCASKHALHGFFNTLRAELAPHGVGVTLICPTFANTAFHRSGLGPDNTPLASERATTGGAVEPGAIAEALYQGVRQRRPIVPVGRTAKRAWLVSRWFPRCYERLMRRRMGGGE